MREVFRFGCCLVIVVFFAAAAASLILSLALSVRSLTELSFSYLQPLIWRFGLDGLKMVKHVGGPSVCRRVWPKLPSKCGRDRIRAGQPRSQGLQPPNLLSTGNPKQAPFAGIAHQFCIPACRSAAPEDSIHRVFSRSSSPCRAVFCDRGQVAPVRVRTCLNEISRRSICFAPLRARARDATLVRQSCRLRGLA